MKLNQIDKYVNKLPENNRKYYVIFLKYITPLCAISGFIAYLLTFMFFGKDLELRHYISSAVISLILYVVFTVYSYFVFLKLGRK